MADLTLTGVSEDGTRLLLTDDSGAEHALPIDQRLRAALREHPARRTEKQMESTLRPRDIQARIRAGESAEQVADAAGTSVDRIMAFAGPVLAERQHVAERAQRSSVRRRAGEAAGTARTLGEAVEAHLRSVSSDPSTVEWDAWRREDGRWALVATYSAAGRSGTAHLTFDAPGNFVVLDDDDARWLVGEAVAEPEPARDDLRQARQRRLTTVDPVDQELPLGDGAGDGDDLGADAIQLVQEQPVEAFLDDRPATDAATAHQERALAQEAADAAARDRAPADGPEELDEVDEVDEVDAEAPTREQPAVRDEPGDQAGEEVPPRRPVRKNRGRASVPSWDEIMFGGGKQE